MVISAPDAIRGNHYHLYGSETIVVVGPALLRFKEGNDIYDFEVPSKQIYQLLLPQKSLMESRIQVKKTISL